MKFLLDTHVLVWFRSAPERLGKETVGLLSSREHSFFVSSVSFLEVAQLVHKGKLRLPGMTGSWMWQTVQFFDAQIIGITPEISLSAYELPGQFHDDPADRMLVCSARIEEKVLITADKRILDYAHVNTVDAHK